MQRLLPDKGWRASDLERGSWLVHLEPEAVAEIERTFVLWKGDGSTGGRGAPPSHLPQVQAVLERAANELEHGRGFLVIRGLPVTRYSILDLRDMLLSLGRLLGTPVPQTTDGSLVGFIQDLDKDINSPTVRGHQTNAELPFHCDRADVVGLLCLRTAQQGGLSRLVSAVAVHDVIAAERPDLLEVLYRPFPNDRRGEESAGQAPWTMLPVFAAEDGRFVSRYIRRFITSAERFPDAPRLTTEQSEALELVDAAIEQPGMVLNLDFRPGDLQLINNYLIWHARTRFDDWPEPERRRLLLRLWLAVPNSRALPHSFRPLYGSVEAGAVRGGVVARS